ncbi:hypothetical protein FOZ62_022059, partial [Perkinsus olseni]
LTAMNLRMSPSWSLDTRNGRNLSYPMAILVYRGSRHNMNHRKAALKVLSITSSGR